MPWGPKNLDMPLDSFEFIKRTALVNDTMQMKVWKTSVNSTPSSLIPWIHAFISEYNLLILHSLRRSTLVSLFDSLGITTLLRLRCDFCGACLRFGLSLFSYLSLNTALPETNDLFILPKKPVVDYIGRLTKCFRELAFPQNSEYLDFVVCQSRGYWWSNLEYWSICLSWRSCNIGSWCGDGNIGLSLKSKVRGIRWYYNGLSKRELAKAPAFEYECCLTRQVKWWVEWSRCIRDSLL